MIRTEPPGITDSDQPVLSLRGLAYTRLAVAIVLSISLLLQGPVTRLTGLSLPAELALAYLAVAFLALIISEILRRFQLVQVVFQLLVDLLFITAIFLSAGGPASGLTMLYLFPVAAGALMTPARIGLSLAAVASIALLAESWIRNLAERSSQDGSLVTAALAASLCFAVALALERLAWLLRRQLRVSAERGLQIQQLQESSQRILQLLPDGIVLLGPEGEVRLINPAARELLGTQMEEVAPTESNAFPLATSASTQALQAILAQRPALSLGEALVLHDLAPGVRSLRVRSLLPSSDASLLLRIEDALEADRRAEQLKLAALGRLTAGIAHEVRNPLAAIAHAAALLAEDKPEGLSLRMLRIIHDNTQRLDRLVEDILALGRRQNSTRELLELDQAVRAGTIEAAGAHIDQVWLQLEAETQIRFTPGHLRQLLQNLVGNALRHSRKQEGSVVVRTRLEEAGPVLEILDDGPGIAAEQRAQLFEPFHTTQARGTGLGLFLSREFCLANEASLDYVELASGEHGFRVSFETPSRSFA